MIISTASNPAPPDSTTIHTDPQTHTLRAAPLVVFV
jgi:hypothetical protein|eukprot:COSAG01_NODE_7760_length_3068_cov_1.624789_3_plen_36_part_00